MDPAFQSDGMNRERIASLHSRYNPQVEAERYINSLSLNEKIRFFILIEPGLGYMVAPLKRKAPDAKVIALHIEKPSQARAQVPAALPDAKADSSWYPETGVSVQEFLETEISDLPASEIRLLEWRPALNVYGHSYLALVEEAAAFIKRSDANARTAKAFGPRWFRNFFKNLSIIKTAINPFNMNSLLASMPLLITGAGPGLEDAIPVIKNAVKNKSGGNDLFILASSSSVAALEANDLTPDLAISTDGSNWAKLHILNSFRDNSGNSTCPLAVAFTAAIPSQCGPLPLLVISDGSFWQALILRKMQIPFIALPQQGTVTAAALDLAFALSGGQIFVAGMDLANQDIRSHARPYSFDIFIEEKAIRTNPAYSQTYRRSSQLKAGGSYGIYASWFKKQLSRYPRPLYPIGKNNPVFDASRAAFPCAAEQGGSPKKFQTISLNFAGNPCEKAFAVLESGLKDPAQSEALQKELKTLILPESKAVSQNELIDAMRSMNRLVQ
jgi:hypothetical protein